MFNIICITITILCVLSLTELLYPTHKNFSNQIYLIALFSTAFLSTIKYYFGPDIFIYVPMYEEIPRIEEILSPGFKSKYEIGFLIFCSICNHWFGLSFWWMTVIIDILFFIALHLVLKQLPYLRTFALFAIILLETNLIFFELRQCLAVTLFTFSMLAFNKEKYIIYAATTIVAILMHKSASFVCMITLFTLLILRFKRTNTLFAVSMVFIVVFLAIPLKSLLLAMSSYLPLDANVLKSIQDHLTIERRVQVIFMIYALVLYIGYIYFSRKKELKTWHAVAVCGLLLIALFYQYWFFINRLRSYFLPFIAIYIINLAINNRGYQPLIKQMSVAALYCLFLVNLSNLYKGNANLKSGIAETSTIFQLRNESAESIKARNMQKAKTYWLTEYIAKE